MPVWCLVDFLNYIQELQAENQDFLPCRVRENKLHFDTFSRLCSGKKWTTVCEATIKGQKTASGESLRVGKDCCFEAGYKERRGCRVSRWETGCAVYAIKWVVNTDHTQKFQECVAKLIKLQKLDASLLNKVE